MVVQTDAERRERRRLRQKERRFETYLAPWMQQIFANRAEYLAKYDELFEQQDGKCGICKKPWVGPKRFHMDHCHETMRIRGLLCFSCNQKLGWYEKFSRSIRRYLK